MRSTRKLTSQVLTTDGNKKFTASLLILLGIASCVGAISLLTVPKVSGEDNSYSTTISLAGVENKKEIVYHAYFTDKDNSQDIINEMYVDKDNNFHLSGEAVALVTTYQMLNDSNIYTPKTDYNKIGSGQYSNIFGLGENEINSANLTIFAGSGNTVASGNDNATMIGGTSNQITGSSNGVPVVMVGGFNNTIEDTNVSVGGSGNVFDNDSTNSWILGGEENAAHGNNNIIAGYKVKVSAQTKNIFAFSPQNRESGFAPQTSNSFYLNTTDGLGLGRVATGGGVASSGVVSVGETNKKYCQTKADVGLQGVLSGCLVGCSRTGYFESLDKSDQCLSDFPKHNNDSPDDSVTPKSFTGYCTGEAPAYAHSCKDLHPEKFTNVIFEYSLKDKCPEATNNQCVYTCDSGYSLNGGTCHKKCELDGVEVKQGDGITGYKVKEPTCPETCTGVRLTCGTGGNLYQTNGKSQGDYIYASCTLTGYKCDAAFTLTETEKSDRNAIYTGCTNRIANNEQNSCSSETLYKLEKCNTGYSLSSDGTQCFENCSYTGDHDVEHGKTKYWYAPEHCENEGQEECKSRWTYECNNGTWYTIGENQIPADTGNKLTSCTLTDNIQCDPNEYNVSKENKQDGKLYTECTNYTYTNKQCKKGEPMYKEEAGCASGYHYNADDDRCDPDKDGVCSKTIMFECEQGILDNTGYDWNLKQTTITYTWDCLGIGGKNQTGCKLLITPKEPDPGVCSTVLPCTCLKGDSYNCENQDEKQTWLCLYNNGKGESAKCTYYEDISCDSGKYLPAKSKTCATCPCGFYCPGGPYNYNESKDQGIYQCSENYYSYTGSNMCSRHFEDLDEQIGFSFTTQNQCEYIEVYVDVTNNSSKTIYNPMTFNIQLDKNSKLICVDELVSDGYTYLDKNKSRTYYCRPDRTMYFTLGKTYTFEYAYSDVDDKTISQSFILKTKENHINIDIQDIGTQKECKSYDDYSADLNKTVNYTLKYYRDDIKKIFYIGIFNKDKGTYDMADYNLVIPIEYDNKIYYLGNYDSSYNKVTPFNGNNPPQNGSQYYQGYELNPNEQYFGILKTNLSLTGVSSLNYPYTDYLITCTNNHECTIKMGSKIYNITLENVGDPIAAGQNQSIIEANFQIKNKQNDDIEVDIVRVKSLPGCVYDLNMNKQGVQQSLSISPNQYFNIGNIPLICKFQDGIEYDFELIYHKDNKCYLVKSQPYTIQGVTSNTIEFNIE